MHWTRKIVDALLKCIMHILQQLHGVVDGKSSPLDESISPVQLSSNSGQGFFAKYA